MRRYKKLPRPDSRKTSGRSRGFGNRFYRRRLLRTVFGLCRVFENDRFFFFCFMFFVSIRNRVPTIAGRRFPPPPPVLPSEHTCRALHDKPSARTVGPPITSIAASRHTRAGSCAPLWPSVTTRRAPCRERRSRGHGAAVAGPTHAVPRSRSVRKLPSGDGRAPDSSRWRQSLRRPDSRPSPVCPGRRSIPAARRNDVFARSLCTYGEKLHECFVWNSRPS